MLQLVNVIALGPAIGIKQTTWGFVELLQIFILYRKVNKLERDTNVHIDPAKDTTDLVPIYQDNLDQATLKDSKEVAAGSEMSLQFKYNCYKKFFTFLAISLNEKYRLTIHEKNYHLLRTV